MALLKKELEHNVEADDELKIRTHNTNLDEEILYTVGIGDRVVNSIYKDRNFYDGIYLIGSATNTKTNSVVDTVLIETMGDKPRMWSVELDNQNEVSPTNLGVVRAYTKIGVDETTTYDHMDLKEHLLSSDTSFGQYLATFN